MRWALPHLDWLRFNTSQNALSQARQGMFQENHSGLVTHTAHGLPKTQHKSIFQAIRQPCILSSQLPSESKGWQHLTWLPKGSITISRHLESKEGCTETWTRTRAHLCTREQKQLNAHRKRCEWNPESQRQAQPCKTTWRQLHGFSKDVAQK